MPFKNFKNASVGPPSVPVLFGSAPSADVPDVKSAPFETPIEPGLKQDHAQHGGQHPSAMGPWSSPADNRTSIRSKSPSKRSLKDDAKPNPSEGSFSSSGLISTSANASAAVREFQPRVASTHIGLRKDLPEQFTMGGLKSQKPRSPLLDSNVSKSPPKFHAYDGKQKSPSPAVARSPSPIQANNSKPRARPYLPQDQTQRLFASAIQQFRVVDEGGVVSAHSEHQRDEQAKERRLRRFNADVDNAATASETHGHIENQSKGERGLFKRVKGAKRMSMDVENTRDPVLDRLTELEGSDNLAERDWQSAEAILGGCPDMCPESERHERERKGDLDRLERLEGDRNQTSKNLAVKKYTRTAEKDSSLIRPLSVLLMTMEYLLSLLTRGYDEELLSVHNFLWDRMRAIRMDLRMQHIFNEQAVAMHEQMIRFHILAMHELCEYAKGEGFSEGFDAHLNIEQMNKASVDLFHMYDDLRKQGNPIASETEFRGYYGLLKLDKHPGYVVEPAELSLDLAKMTPEMRNASEVQFARQVARACRSGNYLAFFRLARNATYLQACLMHAHFSKLRSQAMAALYSGLQKNQGIPIAEVEEWLAMEGEDIEAVAEYHGFSLKTYEEVYMVKEGPFLNKGRDFPTRRSKLVEKKRSWKIKDDVLTAGQEKALILPVLDRVTSFRRQSDSYTTELSFPDEEMPDYEEEEDAKNVQRSYSQHDETLSFAEGAMQEPVMPTEDIMNRYAQDHITCQETEEDEQDEWLWMGKRRKSLSSLVEQETSLDIDSDEHSVIFRDKKPRIMEDRVLMDAPVANVDREKRILAEVNHQQEAKRLAAHEAEANLGKVRLLLRRWKARTASKIEEQHWRQQKLEAALDSFHLGLPLQSSIDVSKSIKAAVQNLPNVSLALSEEELENQGTVHSSDSFGKPHSSDLDLQFANGSDGLKGFFSEDTLKNGISSLASKSPTQPDLCCLHVQDLVLEHLQPSINFLLSRQPLEVTPEICIQTFNEALLRTANEISKTASYCYRDWPPDELREVLEEDMLGKSAMLPRPGWNDASNLQSVLEALDFCQLPQFPMMSTKLTLHNTSLKSQKAALEQALHQYINQICGARQGDVLTLHAVEAIIQKGCMFKGTDSGRLLIPNWPLIFQHLYHMRLALLNSEPPAIVCVSRKRDYLDIAREGNKMDADFTYQVGLTLNEMIEMESQELACQDTHLNTDYRDRNDAVPFQTVDKGLLMVQAFEMSNFETSREENLEALEEISGAGRSETDLATLFELPSKGEIELQNIVNEFCRKVDKQVSETARLEDGQTLFDYNTKHDFSKPVGYNPSPKGFCTDETIPSTVTSPTWATGDGMDNLTRLLNQCETVQRNLDKKLMECLRI